jgi:MFS superfamily sulfate permease-like transporter
LKTDSLAGLVVFLVALPLCLGIALASGAPLVAGIVSGVVGGIAVGALSGSHVSVAGPAAGLTAIVVAAIGQLGSFDAFLAAVVVAGLIQLALGFAKAGMLSSYLPSNVIEGMLAAIGVIIVMKQLPHAVGFRRGEEFDMAFFEPSYGQNSLEILGEALRKTHVGDEVICLAALAILLGWSRVPVLRNVKALPPALMAVLSGVLLNEGFKAAGSPLAVSKDFLVSLPQGASPAEFFSQLTSPDLTAFARPAVWLTGATIAVVASIETLLCIEAADKMDPLKRFTDTNRELKAQGVGNVLCGFFGGLPVTSVIVRTSANINSGALTKTSTICHGTFLLLAVLLIPGLLNRIPLASLAAVLIVIGVKLASPAKFRHMWEGGKYQFVPFAATVLAVVFTDLLKGVAIGLGVSILFILRANMKLAYDFRKETHHAGEIIHIDLAQEVSFLNKAAIKEVLSELPEGSEVVINAARSFYVDHDVLELIRDFVQSGAKERGIKARFVGYKHSARLEHTTLVTSQ